MNTGDSFICDRASSMGISRCLNIGLWHITVPKVIMKIIGGYDYYDSVGGYQNDATRTFVRQKPYSWEVKDTHEWVTLSLPRPEYHKYKFEEDVGTIEVIFCGQYYFGLYYRTFGLRETAQTHYIWDFATLEDALKAKKLHFDEGRYFYYANKRHAIDDIDENFDRKRYPMEDELIKNGVVIATRDSGLYTNDRKSFRRWSKNPSGLKDIHFASVVPPWEAYQEIEMYLGTILVNDADKMVNVSDDVKLGKYGFDKWSFKNKVHNSKPRGA